MSLWMRLRSTTIAPVVETSGCRYEDSLEATCRITPSLKLTAYKADDWRYGIVLPRLVL